MTLDDVCLLLETVINNQADYINVMITLSILLGVLIGVSIGSILFSRIRGIK